MGLKFGRNYVLTINPPQQVTLPGGLVSQIPSNKNTLPIIIQLPFTVEFDITHDIMSSMNVAQIRIYNLSATLRSQIRFNIMDGTSVYQQIVLRAGYGQGPLPIIFQGNINNAWSYREGVDFITTIESYDGGFAVNNGLADTFPPFPAGTPRQGQLLQLMSGFPTLTPGALGPSFYTTTDAQGNKVPATLGKGTPLSGPLQDAINETIDGKLGNRFFIHTEKTYLLSDYECLEGDIPLINSQAGLLSTPIREPNRLTFEMIFEPRILLAQMIQLQSSTDQNFNGFYKVNSLKHRGMISEAVCGDAITSVGLFYSPNNNTANQLITVPFLGGQQ